MSIERPTFPTLRLREAYDAEQVDLAVEMVLENLALPEPRIGRGDLEMLRFTPVRRGGYDMTAVDDWLDEAMAELDRRTGVQPEPEPAPERSPEAPVASSAIVDLAAHGTDEDAAWARPLVMVLVVVVVAVLLYVSFA